MAEFCLECWRKINGIKDDKIKYVLSRRLELCEGCGEWKKVIISEQNFYYGYKAAYFILPFEIIYEIICLLFRLLKLPYLIYKYYKSKNKY